MVEDVSESGITVSNLASASKLIIVEYRLVQRYSTKADQLHDYNTQHYIDANRVIKGHYMGIQKILGVKCSC